MLRETGDNPLSRLIFTSIHSRPASWLAASVLPLVDPHTGDYRELYALILEQSRQEDDIPRLRALASELLVTRLSSLPRERRTESWVRGSILVLGRLRGEASAALLARIRGERRWLILPAWPLECRKAAVAAQQVLQRGREETK